MSCELSEKEREKEKEGEHVTLLDKRDLSNFRLERFRFFKQISGSPIKKIEKNF